MPHHIIKQEDSRFACPYCKIDLTDKSWKSNFESNVHYKEFRCECGKNIMVRLDFLGSGHDNWDGKNTSILKNKKTLENKIKVLSSE